MGYKGEAPNYSDHLSNTNAVNTLEQWLKDHGVLLKVPSSRNSHHTIGDAIISYNDHEIPLGTMPKHKAICFAAYLLKEYLQ